MWAKNHMLRVLTDTVSVASAYLLAFMALYGTFPNGMKWYGLFFDAPDLFSCQRLFQ